MEKSPLFNLDLYIYQLTNDLDNHAQYLHNRDVHNFLRFTQSQREFHMLKSTSGHQLANNQLDNQLRFVQNIANGGERSDRAMGPFPGVTVEPPLRSGNGRVVMNDRPTMVNELQFPQYLRGLNGESELKFKPTDKTSSSMQNGLVIGTSSLLQQNLRAAQQAVQLQKVQASLSNHLRQHHNGLVPKREKKSSTSEDQMIIEVEH